MKPPTLNKALALLPTGGEGLLIPQRSQSTQAPATALQPSIGMPFSKVTAKGVSFDTTGPVEAARAKLTATFETQVGQRCLQHAFNNAWRNRLVLDAKSPAPKLQQSFKGWMDLSSAKGPQEMDRLDRVVAPDGKAMRRVRLFPAQVRALMPMLETHLDLAVVYKGETNVIYEKGKPIESKHYTGLIKVDGTHFELESLGHDETTRKRAIPDLQKYFDTLPGGVLMAIPGAASRPLAAILERLDNERFVRTCEALGTLVSGPQPIIDLASYMTRHSVKGTDLDAVDVAGFCNEQDPKAGAAAHAWPGADTGKTDRAASIVQWLDTLPGNPGKVVLWTGTNPMVMPVERDEDAVWRAKLLTESADGQQEQRLTLAGVLAAQNFDSKPDEAAQRSAYVQALTLNLDTSADEEASLFAE